MSEHAIKYAVTPFVDFTKETLGLEIELPGKQLAREVMNLKEQAIHDGLIALGWTPPGIADRLAEALGDLATELRGTAKEALAAYENHKKQTP